MSHPFISVCYNQWSSFLLIHLLLVLSFQIHVSTGKKAKPLERFVYSV